MDAPAYSRGAAKRKRRGSLLPRLSFASRSRLIAAISARPPVPVGRLALDAIFEVADLVLEPPRLARLDAVARRAIDAPLQMTRLLFELARLAPRQDSPALHHADVCPDPLHAVLHLLREGLVPESIAVIVRLVAIDRRRPLRRCRSGDGQGRSGRSDRKY